MIKKVIAFLVVAAMLLTAAACAAPAAAPAAEAAPAEEGGSKAFPARSADELKFGFIYIGNPGDMGYTYAHDQGRLEMEAATGVKSVIVEDVPENADCEKAIHDLIYQGCNVIVANSFGYLDFVAECAEQNPDIIFLHCSGYKSGPNFANYFGRVYQPRYLSGIVAGLNTKSNKIGYVAAMPIPEVTRGVDAFALGVKSVNPDATVEVIWTNTWFDMAVEKSAALELINHGCDVVTQHQDSPAAMIACEEKGIFGIGYNADMSASAPNAFLCAPRFNWGTYYKAAAQQIIDGTWTNAPYWGGMAEDAVYLTDLSDKCAEGTKEAVEAAKAKIESGELCIFEGPLNDNEGNEKVAAGVKMTDAEMLSVDWFVDNVIGSVPKA